MTAMAWIAVGIATSTVEPIKELKGLIGRLRDRGARRLTVAEVDKLVRENDENGPEMKALLKAFRKMVVVVTASNIKLKDGNYAQAKSSFEDALQLFVDMGNKRGVGICANNLAICHYQIARSSRNEGEKTLNFGNARTFFEQGLAAGREEGDKKAILARLKNYSMMLLTERNEQTLSTNGRKVE
jgi:hypothetical protein